MTKTVSAHMEVKRSDGSVIELNDRIISDEHCCTVKYIGEVKGTNGVWIGVEWDDPDRGKHDGSHNGTKYFQTSHSTSGSFIRPKKVNGGVNCFDAIDDRYGKSKEENAGVIVDELFVMDGKKRRTVVEMVGAESVNLKQSKLSELREVVLRELCVYGVGPCVEELKKHCQNIRELDVSQNLLPSWKHVAEIAQCLPNLEGLNVSKNHLTMPESSSEMRDSFKKLNVLYLNRVGYTWEKILHCSCMFQALEKLHICFNSLKCLSDPGSHLQTLKLLNLESNELSSWNDILVLNQFPLLESLILNDNKIDKIYFPDVTAGHKTKYLTKLKSLLINRNQISEWSSINELNKLQSFEELQINHNPLMASATPETVRQLIVAKVENLKKCSRTEVTDEERRGAEIDYMKRFGPDWLKSGGSQDPEKNNPNEDFQSQHPRYQHFVKVHGAPEDSEMAKKSLKLKDSLISVTITNPDEPDLKKIQKKLPLTMIIQKIKALIQRLYKVDTEMKLTYISTKMPGPEIELDNDLRPLSYFSVEAGDTIYCRWS